MSRWYPLRRLVTGLACLTAASAGVAEAPTIAAASSLREAGPALAEAFHERTGQRVQWSFAATGKLTRQIMRGAPYRLLLAADAEYPQRLVDAGHTRGDGKIYALGKLGLFVPHGSPVAADARLNGLIEALEAGSIERVAIANPEHAPYGRRTRSALQRAGLWQRLQPALVRGDNAAQAAQFGLTDRASVAIIPASLAATGNLVGAGRFQPLDETWYEPLPHRAVLLDGAGAIENQFYRYLSTPEAREILRAHGLTPAPEATD